MPFSRGPERSRPFDDIVDEARALAAAGYREVTLLGQNVNSYGHDLPPDPRFGHVDGDALGRPPAGPRTAVRTWPSSSARSTPCARADGRPAIARLRFVTSHPWDLSDRLIAALAECPSVCEHLHLPVQSGYDAVLRRMGRQYTIEHYLERLARIREAVPGITISTDVIVGFCGETEAQFEATLRLLETVRYDQVFAAAYSPRPGTPATQLADDVPADEKRRRLNELLALQEGIGLRAQPGVAGSRGRRSSWTRSRRRARTTTTTTRRRPRPGAARPCGPVSGRTRGNKLVHLAGDARLLGREVVGPDRARRAVRAAGTPSAPSRRAPG